jgi:hypothetical protein
MKNIKPILPNIKEITLDEKVQYIKEHLYMAESPMGKNYTKEQIDIMVYLINNDWKESGCYHYEWIQTVYREINKNLKNYGNKNS